MFVLGNLRVFGQTFGVSYSPLSKSALSTSSSVNWLQYDKKNGSKSTTHFGLLLGTVRFLTKKDKLQEDELDDVKSKKKSEESNSKSMIPENENLVVTKAERIVTVSNYSPSITTMLKELTRDSFNINSKGNKTKLTGRNWMGEYSYEGEIALSTPHGRGMLTYSSKGIQFSDTLLPSWSTFEGLFEYGRPTNVQYKDAWGSQWHGEFGTTLELVKGRGTYIIQSSSKQSAVYSGTWKNNKCTGKFRFVNAPGAAGVFVYEGDIKEGLWPIGKCKWVEKEGRQYDGEIVFQNGNKMFVGHTECIAEGDGSQIKVSFDGELPMSEGFFGKGQMTIAYQGKSSSEIIYEGEFDCNMEIQRGKRIDPLAVFEGEFEYGKRIHGKSTYDEKALSFEWAGCIFDGQWKREMWHGQGQLIQKNGLIYVGQFEYGNPKGLGFVTNLAGYKELWGLFPRIPTVKASIGTIGLSYGEWEGTNRIKELSPPIGVIPINLGKGVTVGIEVQENECKLVAINLGDVSSLSLRERLFLSYLKRNAKFQ